MNKNMKLNFKWYIIAVLLVSFLWQWMIYATGEVDSKLFPLLMFFPALVAIIFILINKESFITIGWGLKKWWYLFPAFFVPIMITLLTILLLTCFQWASWSNEIFSLKDGFVEVNKVKLILGKQTQTIHFFILNLGLTLLLQSIPGSILTLGEEIGWRGYLQKKLTDKYGIGFGLILLGLIWGYWHLPVILMGWNFPSQPVLGALILMPLGTLGMGMFFGWLYIKTNSIWLPALAHTSLNLSAGLLYAGMISEIDKVVIPLVFIAMWGLVGAICLNLLRKRKSNQL